MVNKRDLDFNDFMAYGWDYIKLLLYAKPTGAQYNPTKINVSTAEKNQDNNRYNSNDENVKYNNKVMDTDEINKLLYSEKTNNIINGNLLCFVNIILRICLSQKVKNFFFIIVINL